METMKILLEEALFPSYIIESTAITIKDEGDIVLAAKLVEKFAEMVGKELPEKEKHLDTKKDVEERISSSIREDFDAEGGASSVSFDPTLADEVQDKLDEQEARAKAIAKIKHVDPLFAILINNEDIAGEYSQDIINLARKDIKEKIPDLKSLGIFQKELEEILDKEIDNFLEEYEKTIPINNNRDSFLFPCMDSNDVISFFDKTDSTFKVSYFIKSGDDNMAMKEKTFDKYSEAVEFINEGTKKFFERLGAIIELKHGIDRLNTKPVMPKFGRKKVTSKTPPQQLGRITRQGRTKMASANADQLRQMNSLITLIEEYHIKPLTGNMILLEDVPEFFTSKEFKDFPILLTSSNVNQARKAITLGANPIVESRDYVALNSFLNYISTPDSLVYNDKLKGIFEAGLDAYVKFWAHADAIVESGSKNNKKIITDSEIVFGDSLYEIASATLTPKEVAEIDFEDEPLPYWNEKQKETNATIESLLLLLESNEWETFVEDSQKGSGIKTQNRYLVDKLKESDIKLTGPITHAMLEATDMLRKMQDKEVYIANLDVSDMDDISYAINLVAKEDKIDIYGIDIYNILKSQSSFNDIADKNRLSTEVVYKIKGLFR